MYAKVNENTNSQLSWKYHRAQQKINEFAAHRKAPGSRGHGGKASPTDPTNQYLPWALVIKEFPSSLGVSTQGSCKAAGVLTGELARNFPGRGICS